MNETEFLQRFAGPAMRRRLGRTAFRLTGNRQLSEEIVQDVFAALAKQARRMDANTVLSCWLNRAVVFCARHMMSTESRRLRKMKEVVEVREEEAALNSASMDPEWREVVDQAIDHLGDEDRKLV